MKNYLTTTKNKKPVTKLRHFLFNLFLCFVFTGPLAAQTSSPGYRILIDISHKQRFWNDPARMAGMDKNQVDRVIYMTDQITKNAVSHNAEIEYLKEEIKPNNLIKCNLLFIHIPSTKFTPGEIKNQQNKCNCPKDNKHSLSLHDASG
jgi:hypothetical protein